MDLRNVMPCCYSFGNGDICIPFMQAPLNSETEERKKKKNVQRRERRRGGEHGAAMLFPRLNVDLIKRVQPFEGAAHFLEMHIL